MYSGVFTFLVEAVSWPKSDLVSGPSIDLADQYPLYAASALAANSFARSYFAAAFPLFGVQMYNSELKARQFDEKAVTDWERCWLPMGDDAAGIPGPRHVPVRRRPGSAVAEVANCVVSLDSPSSSFDLARDSGATVALHQHRVSGTGEKSMWRI